MLEEGARAAEEAWSNMTTETRSTANAIEADTDELEVGGNHRHGCSQVQWKLCFLQDKLKASKLRHIFVETDAVEDKMRLDDLDSEHQEHSWMWALSPVTDTVLPQDEWRCAMRLRLGCEQLSSEMLCASCGERVLDKQGYHALCCAKGESTKGHNSIRDSLHAGFAASDPGAAIEVLGLIPSQPDLRPADILTTATRSSGSIAVDVGICAPHASGAGEDCVETMRINKFDHYSDVLAELEQQRIEYLPATMSCFGRRHPCVTTILSQASTAAARRTGFGNEKAFFRRWSRTIAAKTWQRAARMVMACMPQESPETQMLFDGETH